MLRVLEANLLYFCGGTFPGIIPHNSCHQLEYKYAAMSFIFADPRGRTVSRLCQRLLVCSNCVFESRREHAYLSVVIVVCYPEEMFSKTDPSTRRVLTNVCVCVCVCVSQSSGPTVTRYT